MKPKPLYCEHCGGDGTMCFRCTEDYLERCEQYRNGTPPNKPAPWFWVAFAFGAALAVALIVYAFWPVK